MDRAEESTGGSASYYTLLGVPPDASAAEIRASYRKLAMKWHPDRWCRARPRVVEEAKRRFQQIQEAYQVLSDNNKRSLYDAGLYNPFEDEEDEVEGFSDFVQEMLVLMADAKKEKKQYSLEELQRMLAELAQSFESPPPPPPATCPPSVHTSRRSTKRSRCDMDTVGRSPRANFSTVGVFGTSMLP